VREAIASALEARGRIEGRVLDLYAGTGAMAFEMLSRGATEAVLVEKRRGVARAIEKSARELGLSDRVRVVVADLSGRDAEWTRALRAPLELVLADPPYAQIGEVPRLLEVLGRGHLTDDATVVVEHASKGDPIEPPAGFAEISRYRYGDTAVLLARYAPDPDEDS